MKDKFKVSEFFDSSMKITFCNENDSILKAKSLMLLNDFSQIPILNKDQKIIGAISWKSIGISDSLKKDSTNILDFLEEPAVINETDDFLKYMKLVAKKDYVFVKNKKDELKGIITSYDMTINFKEFIVPFLHLGIIEDCIRILIQSKGISGDKDVDNMTFGEYKKIFGKDENWNKLNLQLFDKNIFIEKLEEIRILRNSIAHYKRKGLSADEIHSINSFAVILQKVCS